MTLEIKNIFGNTVKLMPGVHLYRVQDFMGTPLHGLGINLVEADGESAGEPFATLTVSFGEFIGFKDCAYIDTNNCTFAPQLLTMGIAEDTGFTKRSGYCEYPLWHFKEDFLKKIGGDRYLQYSSEYDQYMSAISGQDEEVKEEMNMV